MDEDFIDKANLVAENRVEQALGRGRRAEPLPPKGTCYFCDEPLEDPLRFCDADCRDGYDSLLLRQKRNPA